MGEVIFEDRVIFGPVDCPCGYQIYFGFQLWKGVGESSWRERSGVRHVCAEVKNSEWVPSCPCGGDASFEYHAETIAHKGYLLRVQREHKGGFTDTAS